MSYKAELQANNIDLQSILDTVNALPDAEPAVELPELSAPGTAADLRTGKQMLNGEGVLVNGSMTDNGTVVETLDTKTSVYTIPAGYHNGEGSVSISTETKAVTPSKTAQTVSPSEGKVLSEVSVAAIPDEYITTEDATAAVAEILEGKTAYARGTKLTGTMPTVAQATPSITVSSSGLITASATQSGGKVEAGTKSATKQLTTQAAKTITPSTSAQTAVASGKYTTGAVTVAGDANLVAENIVSGKSIFGVAGSASEGKAYMTTIEPSSDTNMIAITCGFRPKYIAINGQAGLKGYALTDFLINFAYAENLDEGDGTTSDRWMSTYFIVDNGAIEHEGWLEASSSNLSSSGYTLQINDTGFSLQSTYNVFRGTYGWYVVLVQG